MKKLLTTISTITLSLSLLFTSVLPTLASEVNPNINSNSSITNISNISEQSSMSSMTTKTIRPTKITLNKKSTSINVGSSETLTPTTATNQNVTWKSSNTKIATVDSSGLITGIKAGKANITVTTIDGKKKATCKVTIKTAPIVKVTGISLDKSSMTINVGDTETLIPTITPDNATSQNITWESSNEEIAIVDSEGNITGLKSGNATITSITKDGNKKATCEITVVAVEDDTPIVNVESVSLDRKTISMKIGENETLTAIITPNDATNKNLIWNSSNESVLTVDQNGRIVAVGSGTSNITVTSIDGNKTDICEVTVEKDEIQSVQFQIFIKLLIKMTHILLHQL